jgi:hypothetical protein
MIDHEAPHADPVAGLIRDAAPDRFDAGFGDRVLARLRAEPSLSVTLERQFLKLVPLVAAASLMLAGYNWWGARSTSSSAIDAALNLPQVTLSAAYSPSVLYGAAASLTETP